MPYGSSAMFRNTTKQTISVVQSTRSATRRSLPTTIEVWPVTMVLKVARFSPADAARASTLLAATSALVPFTVGVVVTTGSKVAWDCSARRRLKCQSKPAT